jgi:hypothetical protein
LTSISPAADQRSRRLLTFDVLQRQSRAMRSRAGFDPPSSDQPVQCLLVGKGAHGHNVGLRFRCCAAHCYPSRTTCDFCVARFAPIRGNEGWFLPFETASRHGLEPTETVEPGSDDRHRLTWVCLEPGVYAEIRQMLPRCALGRPPRGRHGGWLLLVRRVYAVIGAEDTRERNRQSGRLQDVTESPALITNEACP